MPLRKFRYDPEVYHQPRDLPRLAADHDAFVPSPVHDMQQNLYGIAEHREGPELDLYPGWIRLAFPLVASGGLWLMIYWAVRLCIRAVLSL